MKMSKNKPYLNLNWGLGISLFMIICLLGGCASKGDTVSDKLMFWKESEPIRIRPKRYDGVAPQSTPSAESSTSSAVESTDASAVAPTSEPNAEASEESQSDDPYEGMSAAERKQMEKIEREAEAIRKSERVKSRLFRGL